MDESGGKDGNRENKREVTSSKWRLAPPSITRMLSDRVVHQPLAVYPSLAGYQALSPLPLRRLSPTLCPLPLFQLDESGPPGVRVGWGWGGGQQIGAGSIFKRQPLLA